MSVDKKRSIARERFLGFYDSEKSVFVRVREGIVREVDLLSQFLKTTLETQGLLNLNETYF